MKNWWGWFYISFVMLITFTILQYRFLIWITQEKPDTIYLIGWGISLLVVVGLLIYKRKQESNIQELKQENERLREAVEYYRSNASI
ncbi:hypothetical protein DXT76_14955 [Halobacillus trueperi]|uniref:Uncharacterized protein n=1 Tax=Halobacillus trueperi TaxID=156205 RepID=A0A3D8VMH9_9BACI|nr:hypothetical protein [Halobacillus trueperi]RDY70028.1 hypothetical protein DXT76_14955 [Halobacillus trueperi]